MIQFISWIGLFAFFFAPLFANTMRLFLILVGIQLLLLGVATYLTWNGGVAHAMAPPQIVVVGPLLVAALVLICVLGLIKVRMLAKKERSSV